MGKKMADHEECAMVSSPEIYRKGFADVENKQSDLLDLRINPEKMRKDLQHR